MYEYTYAPVMHVLLCQYVVRVYGLPAPCALRARKYEFRARVEQERQAQAYPVLLVIYVLRVLKYSSSCVEQPMV